MTGKHVIITRPENKQKKTLLDYERAGFNPHALPCITIETLINDESLSLLQEAEQSQVLIILSANALIHAKKIKPDFRVSQQTRVLAIGPAVKRCWQSIFSHPIEMPKSGHSESMLELLEEFKKIESLSILTAANGRQLIKRYCLEKGINFKQINTYQRLPLTIDQDALSNWFKRHERLFLTATSTEIISHLKQQLSPPAWEYLSDLPIICGSQRIADFAVKNGFIQTIVAHSPSNQNMIKALELAH